MGKSRPLDPFAATSKYTAAAGWMPAPSRRQTPLADQSGPPPRASRRNGRPQEGSSIPTRLLPIGGEKQPSHKVYSCLPPQSPAQRFKGVQRILQLWGKREPNSRSPKVPIALIRSLWSPSNSPGVVSSPQLGSERPRLFTAAPRRLFAGSSVF